MLLLLFLDYDVDLTLADALECFGALASVGSVRRIQLVNTNGCLSPPPSPSLSLSGLRCDEEVH